MRRVARTALTALMLTVVAACAAEVAPSATPPPTASRPAPTASAVASAGPDETHTPRPSATATPQPTPEPPLSLEMPETTDDRRVSVAVVPEVGPDGGVITVTVTSDADSRIDELVLRWPTELGDSLLLAPFIPSEDRIREGGPPLVQEWTKWVVGPGEHGEPAGTISFGYGPLLPGATLEIPIFVTRRADGPIAFDLQVLAGNDLLTLDDGEAAELRVEVP